jgi:DNA-binding transcriptional regulator YdaS (Cro superfamily)
MTSQTIRGRRQIAPRHATPPLGRVVTGRIDPLAR